jgi:hypothetical protein
MQKETGMYKETILALLLASAASPLFAADTMSQTAAKPTAVANECAKLEKSFDAARKEHVAPQKLKDAKAQRARGGELCAKGHIAEGVKTLKKALHDIRVS